MGDMTPLGFRFPEGTDPATIAEYFQNLAEDLDDWLTGKNLDDIPTMSAFIQTLLNDADAATARSTLGFSNATTDLGLTGDAGVAAEVDPWLVALLARKRKVASSVIAFRSATPMEASRVYLNSEDNAYMRFVTQISDSAGSSHQRPAASGLWRPSSDDLLPTGLGVSLKGVLTLRCWAASGENNPSLAAGEVTADLLWITPYTGGAAGEFKYAHDAASILSGNAPVVTGNGAGGAVELELEIDNIAADVANPGNVGSASYAMALGLKTSAGFAMGVNSQVDYHLELFHHLEKA